MGMTFTTFSHVSAIDRSLWNELAESASPMMEWEYFHALEESECVSPERGYKGSHLVAYSDGVPVAVAPLYQRDRAWVEFGDGGLIEFLTELTGLPFHLGLVATVPYTPVPGYQFLVRPGEDANAMAGALLDQIDHLCTRRGLLTSRIYFVGYKSHDLHSLLEQRGYLELRSSYRLWFNRSFQSFDDYLATFKSSRRTKIKREIRSVRQQGIDVRMIPGSEAPDSFFTDMHQLYKLTWSKHMGFGMRPFLNEEFFNILGRTFRHRIRFTVASDKDENLAMAIFYVKNGDLYGRYWGCFREVPFLHFSACYYTPIAQAIREGLQMMDPGFGGEHKLIRGYEMVPVYHFIKFYGEQPQRIAEAVLRQLRREAAGW